MKDEHEEIKENDIYFSNILGIVKVKKVEGDWFKVKSQSGCIFYLKRKHLSLKVSGNNAKPKSKKETNEKTRKNKSR